MLMIYLQETNIFLVENEKYLNKSKIILNSTTDFNVWSRFMFCFYYLFILI